MKNRIALAAVSFAAGWLSHTWVAAEPPDTPLPVAPAIDATPPPTPQQFRDTLVVRIARDMGIDPTLALAVAWVENPNADTAAISRAGAVGLMQVMSPAAFRRRGNEPAARARAALVAAMCGHADQLMVPACNVRVGLTIYAQYLEQYGNEHRALVAYNGALQYPRAAARYVAAVNAHRARLGATQ